MKLHLSWTVKVMRIINGLLLVSLVLLGVYIIILPLVPNIVYKFDHQTSMVRYQSKLAAKINPTSDTAATLQPAPVQNQLIIPQIGIDSPVLEGDDIKLLNRGFWHRPGTGTPSTGGNTVIVGHRYVIRANTPNTMYHIDKLKVGDEFLLFWEGESYLLLFCSLP